MNYIQIPDVAFDRIIETLQRGYDVCDKVDHSSDDIEKSPSYATGYSRATLRDVIEELNRYNSSGN
jgi:hypothetical protein